jgi:hypothetical protein
METFSKEIDRGFNIYLHLLKLLCFFQTGRSFLEQLRIFFHEILLSALHLKTKKNRFNFFWQRCQFRTTNMAPS